MLIPGLDFFQTLTLLVMIFGLIGVLLPLIPGSLIIWLAALGYHLIRGFSGESWIVFGLLTVLMLASSTTELWVSSAGARRGGASGCAIVAAAIAGIVGLLFFSLLGAILLPTLTVLVIELIRLRDLGQAARAGRGYFVGWLLSSGIELTMAVAMIAIWVWHIGGWQALVGF